MNTTTRFFQTKEQHKAFRAAFAAGQNDKRARKSFTDGVTSIWDSQTRKYSQVAIKIKSNGWMTSAHYLLFNLVTGRNYYNGFTPKTQPDFIAHNGDPDRGLNGAITELAEVVNAADCLIHPNPATTPSWKVTQYQTKVNKFLEPLGGVFTLQDLARVQLPQFPGCYAGNDTKEVSGKKINYRELFGPQVVDQAYEDEELIAAIATALNPAPVAEPEKKGFFGRLFGGAS